MEWTSRYRGICAWWRHQMVTFSALLAPCAGNSPVTGEFPAQWPVTRSFDVFFDLHLNDVIMTSQWRHNECHDVSNHQPHDFLLKRLFRRRSKKTLKFHLTGLCVGNSPVTAAEFPAQRPVTRKMFPFNDVTMRAKGHGIIGATTIPQCNYK